LAGRRLGEREAEMRISGGLDGKQSQESFCFRTHYAGCVDVWDYWTVSLFLSMPLFRVTVFTVLGILEAVLVYQCLFWWG
jgi:hypothetical protein